MANENLKKFYNSFVIWEVQIKTIIQYNCTFIRIPKDGVMEFRVCCTHLTSKTEALIPQTAGTVSNYIFQLILPSQLAAYF